MNQERTTEVSATEEGVPKEATLKQERNLADKVAGARASEFDPEKLEAKISTILLEKPNVTFEAFKEIWRRHIQEQLTKGRAFPEIWKSVVEFDNTGREDLGPDVPVDEMYERLNTAVMQLKGESPAAVEKIIREVVLEFKPKRAETPR